MVHPVGIQHILTNSSTAEKTQQSNYTQADGQQKQLATKLQKEKRGQKQRINQMEKSDQMKIKKEKEKQNRQNLLRGKKAKAKSPKEKPSPKEGSSDTQQEGTSKIDILV